MDESPGDEIDKNEMENTVLHYNHEHKRKLELGKVLLEIVINREVDEDLYLKKSVDSFPENVEFKPWQLSILEEVEIPTKRKIIWVVGKSCGEGKTWLQNYIRYKYGDRRVVSGISLQTKSGNITHALTKHPLSTAYIFLSIFDTFQQFIINFSRGIHTLGNVEKENVCCY